MRLSIIGAMICTVIFISLSNAATQHQFDSTLSLICTNNFTLAQEQIEAIKLADSTDPDYFILTANMYFQKAQSHFIGMVQGQPTEDSVITLLDSSGNAVGFLDESTSFDNAVLDSGITALSQGLSLHPDRVDCHFGLIHMLEVASRYGEMSDALIAVIKRGIVNGHQWWTLRGQRLEEEPRSYVLENVQSRVRGVIDLNYSGTEGHPAHISELLIECFPESVYGYTNIGALHSMYGRFRESLSYLLRAHAIDKTDPIVIANIAISYERSGQTEEAITYFDLLMKYGDGEQQNFAKQKLSQLKK